MNTTQRNIRSIGNGQSGFTLIEIIAVLVIIGMLAAVAVPKYIAMQQSAANGVIAGALGAGASACSIAYSNRLMLGDSPPTAISNAVTDLNNATTGSTTLGDFTYSYVAQGTTGITVTVTNGTGPGLSAFNNKGSAAVLSKTVTFQ